MVIGPSFSQELSDAGLAGAPIAWTAEGEIFGRENLTTEQSAALDAVIAAHDPDVPPATPIPAISPRQLRLMMIYTGTSDADIEAAIQTIPDPLERDLALAEWRWAGQYERTHPLVPMLADELGFTPEELDDLWTYAATL